MRKLFALKKIKQALGRDQDGTETAQQIGDIIHHNLTEKIKQKDRESQEGKLLKKIEKEFGCTFFEAKVPIYGYSIQKLQIRCYSGEMDALAFRHGAGAVLEVFVVEWKTYSRDVSKKWWKEATHFKKPLYQSLIYRELLQAHLKENGLKARVGIMLVPIFQLPGLNWVKPGLCTKFNGMDKVGLLDNLKEYQWFGEQSNCVHTITLPSRLFNLQNLESPYVDESTKVLTQDTKVTDVINSDATIADLCEELGLLALKVERAERVEESPEA